MDDDIAKFLEAWDLQDYIPNRFNKNKITLATLGLLDSEIMKELTPPIGDKARNLGKWNALTVIAGDPTSDEHVPIQVDYLDESHRNITISDLTNIPGTIRATDSPKMQSYSITSPLGTNSVISLSPYS